ncbi:(deoxy)nucleoside triphosphate pyrophosphohydrolase [Leifsonia poae]|uniref:(deoxy)nucleoside triphosphate pyrophosphohydrolase n=1 Tax=Leifsonia poae TaxID=110933 RepID=UPI003D680014
MTTNPDASLPEAPTLEVVAAIIVDDDTVLACRRAPHKDSAGLWEFPGGKVERGESRPESLAREIREELGVKIRVGREFDRSITEVNGRRIALTCFLARLADASPTISTDHDRMRWVIPADLPGLDWALPDLPAVHKLVADGI